MAKKFRESQVLRKPVKLTNISRRKYFLEMCENRANYFNRACHWLHCIFCRKTTVLWPTEKFAAVKWKMPTLKELTMEVNLCYLEAFLTTFWIRIQVHMLDGIILLCPLELWLTVHRSQERQILHYELVLQGMKKFVKWTCS